MNKNCIFRCPIHKDPGSFYLEDPFEAVLEKLILTKVNGGYCEERQGRVGQYTLHEKMHNYLFFV